MEVSKVVSTILSLSTWTSTSFSIVYQTSIPVIAITQTSIASQFSTAIHTSSITQSEIIMASTIAVPITVTNTLTNILTSTLQPSLIPSASTITETITSTILQPDRTLTFTLPTPTTTVQLTTQWPPYNTVVTISPTVTVTEILFYLENGAGDIYSTITTTVPSQTSAVVIVPGHSEDNGHGWGSWSDAQRGGLIAGVVLAFLLILLVGLLVWWCLRRRNVWVAGEWETNPSMAVQQPGALVIPQSYWGSGYAGGWRI